MSTRANTLLFVLLALGCDNKDNGGGQGGVSDSGDADADTDTDTDADLTLTFGLDADTSTAGQGVTYTIKAVDSDGGTEDVSGYTLYSDIEADLADDGSAITPTLAGIHMITASANIDGEDQTADVALEVTPGDLVDLDLTLDAFEVIAGEPLGFSVTGSDVYGNAVNTEDIEVSADSVEVVTDSATATSIVTGTYVLTAESGDVSDSETFEVIAADPTSLYLELSETELEAGDSTDAIVTMYDEFGNVADAAWTLTVDGTGAATIDGAEITFDEEGFFTITVTLDEFHLDAKVYLTIDSNGPLLEIGNPDRGHSTTDGTVELEGTVTDNVTGVGSLQVDGEDLGWSSSGAFSKTIDLQHGINIIQTVATDMDTPDPNTSDDSRAVLHADSVWSTAGPMDYGIIARINEGDGGLETLAEAAEGLISIDDLEDMMVGTLVSNEWCIGSSWWEICTSYWVSVTSVDASDIDLEFDTYDGRIRVRATFSDVDVDGNVYTSLTGTDGYTLTVSSLQVTALLDPSVSSSGSLSVAVDSVVSTATGLSFDAGGAAGAIESIAEFVGFDVDGEVEDRLLDAVDDTVADVIPDMVEDTLDSVGVSETFSFAGNSYTISATLTDIEVLYTGIELPMSTRVIPDDTLAAFLSEGPPGSPYAGYSPPTFAATSGGTELAISLDFINQALRAFWAGGLMDTQLTDEELGIEMAAIALVLPGLSDLTLVTQARLPAVIVPYEDGEEEENVQLQVGDLLVQLYDGEVSDETLYMELYVSALVPATLTASAAGDEIVLVLGDADITVDVVYPDGSTSAAAGAESAFELLLPVFLPEITGAFGEVPIPSFAGFELSSVSTEMVGTGGAQGYLGLSGDLDIE